MKRFALAAALLVGGWLSVSMGQQITPPEERPTFDGREIRELSKTDLIADPNNPPEEQPGIAKHDVDDDFFSLLKVGHFVMQSKGGYGENKYRLTVVTHRKTMKVSRIGNDYVELLQTESDTGFPKSPVRRRIHKSMIVEIEVPEPTEPEKAT